MKRDLHLLRKTYENKDDEWVIIFKFHNIEGKDDYYTFKPVKDLTSEEKSLIDSLSPVKNANGIKTKSKVLEAPIKGPIKSIKDYFPSRVVAHFGPKRKMQGYLDSYKHVHKHTLNANLVERVPVKDKTKEHFSGIISGINEGRKTKVPREYILFFGIYSRKFSNKYAEGNLMRYEDMSENDKKTLSMMRRYATTGDFMAYEMKADYVKYTAFVAFVGSEKEIREIVERYQEDYGKDFVLKERVPMKPKTREHFGGIIESKEEDKELYALILHFHRKDHIKDFYFIKKLEDLNDKEKEILNSKEGKTTSFKQGIHKFREYHPDSPKSDLAGLTGRRILMYVAPKNILERELNYYKLAYGNGLEPGVTVKPETKKHFGDIVSGINESKQEDKYILLLKIHYPRGEETPFADYKHTRLEGISDEDRKIVNKLVDCKASYAHGLHYDDKELDIRKGGHIGKYSTVIAVIGPKDKVKKEFIHFKKSIYGTRMIEEPYIKPETEKHFGDILKGINESKEDEYVLIQRFKIDKNGIYKNGKYALKPASELTKKEKNILSTLQRSHSYMDKYFGYDIEGNDEYNMVFGTKDYLENDVEDTKKYMIGGSFEEEIPMKPKTKESFADIFDRLNEKREKEPLYVLILKYRKLYSSKYNEVIYYSLKPVEELKGVYKKAYNLAGDWFKPYFNKRIETTKDWVRFDNWAFNMFRGSESSMKSELRDHEAVNKLVEDEPVPMKPGTEKHFGDIIN